MLVEETLVTAVRGSATQDAQSTGVGVLASPAHQANQVRVADASGLQVLTKTAGQRGARHHAPVAQLDDRDGVWSADAGGLAQDGRRLRGHHPAWAGQPDGGREHLHRAQPGDVHTAAPQLRVVARAP
ncbi:hypothetical protein [Ornithinimicrobium kibberense]|uniref:hypothetical protein n=1 Tax=Ornithinimicrobium kibberense TaxID=282060 RepID=UPI00360CCD71